MGYVPGIDLFTNSHQGLRSKSSNFVRSMVRWHIYLHLCLILCGKCVLPGSLAVCPQKKVPSQKERLVFQSSFFQGELLNFWVCKFTSPMDPISNGGLSSPEGPAGYECCSHHRLRMDEIRWEGRRLRCLEPGQRSNRRAVWTMMREVMGVTTSKTNNKQETKKQQRQIHNTTNDPCFDWKRPCFGGWVPSKIEVSWVPGTNTLG